MSSIQATSFEFENTGSTIFTVTKPGGTKDTINSGQKKTYNAKGVYSADVGGVQAFTINFTAGDNTITKGSGSAPAGTSAEVKTFLN